MSALRISLTKKADRIACSYGCERPVTIRVIQRRTWIARLILGNPYTTLYT